MCIHVTVIKENFKVGCEVRDYEINLEGIWGWSDSEYDQNIDYACIKVSKS